MTQSPPSRGRQAALGYESLWHGGPNEQGLSRKLRNVFTWLDDCRTADMWLTHEAIAYEGDADSAAWRRHLRKQGYTKEDGYAVVGVDKRVYGYASRFELRKEALHRAAKGILCEQTMTSEMIDGSPEFDSKDSLEIELNIGSDTKHVARGQPDDRYTYFIIGFIIDDHVDRAWLTRAPNDEQEVPPPKTPNDVEIEVSDDPYVTENRKGEQIGREICIPDYMEIVEIPRRASQGIKWLAQAAWELGRSNPRISYEKPNPDDKRPENEAGDSKGAAQDKKPEADPAPAGAETPRPAPETAEKPAQRKPATPPVKNGQGYRFH